MTVAEFANRAGVTPRRVRALVASGRIRGAIKIGRDWLIPVAAPLTPGRRGPKSRAAGAATRVRIVEPGQGLSLKGRRQRRFRKAALRSPGLAQSAVAFRLPREAIRFEERSLVSEDLP